jgi:hypothetical protein
MDRYRPLTLLEYPDREAGNSLCVRRSMDTTKIMRYLEPLMKIFDDACSQIEKTANTREQIQS